MPPLVADRDIVQYIGRRHDEDTNTTYLLYRNATHSERPERKGIVRSVGSYISSWTISLVQLHQSTFGYAAGHGN